MVKPSQVVMGRTGEIRILDKEKNRVLITNHVPYGAFLKVKDGQKVEKGDELCNWDPYNAVILSEFDGTIEYEAIIEGITYKEESDEQTGHREKVITDTRDKTKNPAIIVKGKTDTKGYNIPVGAHLAVDEGEKIKAGQVLAKIPRTMGKSRDITGGLPRVTELFEARNPSNPAVVSEIDGVVTYGGIKRGNREIFIESRDGVQKRYLVPLSKHILVQDNDFVRAGQPLSDGSITPSDILSIKGPTAVQEYLVNEIQEVYRLQGVKINDKHIEAIVSQMMQKVEIIDPGDTSFLTNEYVDKLQFREDNDTILDKKVVIEAGDSPNLETRTDYHSREFRDENSVLAQERSETCRSSRCDACCFKTYIAGYYSGFVEDGKLAVSRFIPGNNESTERSCYPWKNGLVDGLERKRYCRSPYPCRYWSAEVQRHDRYS